MNSHGLTRRRLVASTSALAATSLLTAPARADRPRRNTRGTTDAALDAGYATLQVPDLEAVGLQGYYIVYAEDMPAQYMVDTFISPTMEGLEKSGYVGGSLILFHSPETWTRTDGKLLHSVAITSNVSHVQPDRTAEAFWPVLEDGDEDLDGYGAWGDQSEISTHSYGTGKDRSDVWDMSIRKGPMLSSTSFEVQPGFLSEGEVLDLLSKLAPIVEQKMDAVISGAAPGLHQRVPLYEEPGHIYWSHYRTLAGTSLLVTKHSTDADKDEAQDLIDRIGLVSSFTRQYKVDVDVPLFASPYGLMLTLNEYASEDHAASSVAIQHADTSETPEVREFEEKPGRTVRINGERFHVDGASWIREDSDWDTVSYTVRESITIGSVRAFASLISDATMPTADLTPFLEALVQGYRSKGTHTSYNAWPADVLAEAEEHIAMAQ